MQIKFTDAQQNAINAKNGEITVSAAAGSGKTAVLAERVIRMLTDKNAPVPADRILVVTFTRAAAAEMKERINKKFDALISESPMDRTLRRQQLLLSKALICTIDSFCSELVKENFHKLGITQNFRIADENELLILESRAMENTLSHFYEIGEDGFVDFTEAFGSEKNDKTVENAVYKLYSFIRSHPFPLSRLKKMTELYVQKNNVKDTVWGRVVFDFALSAAADCIDKSKLLLNTCIQSEALHKAFYDGFTAELSFFEHLQSILLSGDWNGAYEAINTFGRPRLMTPRGFAEDPLVVKIKLLRESQKSTLESLKKQFYAEEVQVLSDISFISGITGTMLSLVSFYDEELNRLKAEKNVLDFSDLEHLAVRLLVKESPQGFEKTEDAISAGERFDLIMIDEYQDANEIQDLIFSSISKDGINMFVVGDVKQSIYRFRQANPGIFINRKERTVPYDPHCEIFPARVVLDRNFRSRKGITDAVNFIFSRIMSKEVGEIEYNEEEMLVNGAVYPASTSPDVLVNLLDLDTTETQDADTEEARHIAEQIAFIKKNCTVTDGDTQREATFGDFCILLRSASGHAQKYVKELLNLGIPAFSKSSEKFLHSNEISFIINLLRVIDNPIQDIPLASALISPVFGFTPDDLTAVRLANEKSNLYTALKKAGTDFGGKFSDTLETLERIRTFASTVPTDRLISFIYDITSYKAMAAAMPDGAVKINNLELLLDYAKNFEASGYRGVSEFITFIDRIEQNGGDLQSAVSAPGKSPNAVSVMSIHASKGLEYPFCILAGTARRLRSDKNENVLLHYQLALGARRRDADTNVRYSTLPRNAIALETARDEKSEELRVLYVAMTRAREKLIIYSSVKNLDGYISKLSANTFGDENISPFSVRAALSHCDWIIMCLLRHKSGGVLRRIAGNFEESAPFDESAQGIDVNIISSPTCCGEEAGYATPVPDAGCQLAAPLPDPDFTALLMHRLDFKYKNEPLCRLPVKVTASGLTHKSTLTDEDTLKRPSFMHSGRITGTMRGTATHEFLQLCEFKKASTSPEDEKERLKKDGFITDETADAIDMRGVKSFFKSALYRRIIQSAHVYKEYRFACKISADTVDPDIPDELRQTEIILQGAADLVFAEGDEIVIVDYKTDRVSSLSELAQKYSPQLDLYSTALFECTGKKIKERIIYSLFLNESVSV